MEVEIGRGKKGRRAYGLDDIAIVPSRRTRDPDDIDLTWTLGPYRFELPLLAAAMDGVVSPRTAGVLGKLGGLAVLNLEGIWTRYESADAELERIAGFPKEIATAEMQRIYAEPVKEELIAERIREIKDQGVVAAASLTPQRVRSYYETAIDAGLDEFIREGPVPVVVGGCASYATGLHLMRTGAVGVLVGVGPGSACTTRGVLGIGVPQATATLDVAAARDRFLVETDRYIPIVTDGGMKTGGDIAKAIASGADAVMLGSPFASALEAPGRGYNWGMAAPSPALPRGTRISIGERLPLEQILFGPSTTTHGTQNLVGALRQSMAALGARTIREMHEVEMVVAPAIATEGKSWQRAGRE